MVIVRARCSCAYEPDNHGGILLLEFIGRYSHGAPADFRMPMREAMMPTIDAIVWNETENCSLSSARMSAMVVCLIRRRSEHLAADAGLIP